MGAFFALLRNPVVILMLVSLILLYYYYQRVMGTFVAYTKAREVNDRKEKRANNLWSEYEHWRETQRNELPKLSLEGIFDLQVKERAQEEILSQLQAIDGDEPEVKAWRLSLQDAKLSVLEQRKKIQKCEADWNAMQSRFPYNFLIGLLNLQV
ncbi:MAG: hypothetical protein AAF927_13565 [Bacteroidota bacterium]